CPKLPVSVPESLLSPWYLAGCCFESAVKAFCNSRKSRQRQAFARNQEPRAKTSPFKSPRAFLQRALPLAAAPKPVSLIWTELFRADCPSFRAGRALLYLDTAKDVIDIVVGDTGDLVQGACLNAIDVYLAVEADDQLEYLR